MRRDDESPPDLFAAVTAAARRPIAPERAASAIARLAAAVLDLDAGRIDSLFREEGWLDPSALRDLPPGEFNGVLKARKLAARPAAAAACVRVLRWFAERPPEAIDALADEVLRDELLGLRGIGAATADRILADGFDRRVYPVDRGSYRIAVRHGWIDTTAGLDEVRGVFEGLAPAEPAALRALAAGLEAIASRHCRPRRADCDGCPLRPWLPASGPVELDTPD